MNKALVIMAKRPEWGKVKTRLAATIGHDRALQVYSALLGHTLKVAAHFDGAVYWTGQGSTPTTALSAREQVDGDLGQRMSTAIRQEQNDRSGVVVIGTDCPGLRPEHIEQAMQLLERNAVVLGPTSDGGYYLIGMRSLQEDLFVEMPWSTDKVFQLTLDACRKRGLSIATLPIMADVDNEEDWRAQQQRWTWLAGG